MVDILERVRIMGEQSDSQLLSPFDLLGARVISHEIFGHCFADILLLDGTPFADSEEIHFWIEDTGNDHLTYYSNIHKFRNRSSSEKFFQITAGACAGWAFIERAYGKHGKGASTQTTFNEFINSLKGKPLIDTIATAVKSDASVSDIATVFGLEIPSEQELLRMMSVLVAAAIAYDRSAQFLIEIYQFIKKNKRLDFTMSEAHGLIRLGTPFPLRCGQKEEAQA